MKNSEILDVFRDYLLSLHQKSTDLNKIKILLLTGVALILMQAYSINLVDEFHGGCGMKEQED